MDDRLQWTERYSVGVPELDRDHQQLFRSVNSLIEEIQQGNRGAVLHELLDLILEDVMTHFEREERTLEQAQFPDLADHRAEHDLLLRAVLRFKFELKYDRLDSAYAARFLVDWVRQHLDEKDLKFKPYLAAMATA